MICSNKIMISTLIKPIVHCLKELTKLSYFFKQGCHQVFHQRQELLFRIAI